MVFCNFCTANSAKTSKIVTILILIDGFLQFIVYKQTVTQKEVTILILIDGFLQLVIIKTIISGEKCHNPYFNRWFSAIHIRYDDYVNEIASQSLF